ncbi:hypothetical protein BGZ52_012464 [Haplosporangium bisporale]|nr:hypothetical protein BGZ52_012464 [Haplosporangium bisporale]
MTSRPSLESLPPEVQGIVTDYLDMKDLTTCVIANSDWKAIFTPPIWSTINMDRGSQFAKFSTPAVQQALTRNARYIKHLSIHFSAMLDCVVPDTESAQIDIVDPSATHHVRKLIVDHSLLSTVWTNLCTLEVHSCLQPIAFETQIVALVRRNRGLISLRLGHDQAVETIQELASVLRPSLREFHLSTPISPNTAKFFLENLPDGIRTISLNIQIKPDEQVDHEYSPTEVGPRPHLLLESLRITGVFAGYQEHVLLPFLACCSTKLKKIDITDTGYFSSKDIGSALALLDFDYSSLYPAEFPNGKDSLDDEIADLLESNPQVTSVYLTNCRSAGWRTAAALHSIEHLHELNLCGSDLPSRELRTILAGAKNLRFLDAISPRPSRKRLEAARAPLPMRMNTNDPLFFSNDLVEGEWATTTLERFVCRVLVQRPAWHVPVPAGPLNVAAGENTMEVYHAMQRPLYRKLALQTHLRELTLGCNVASRRDFQWNCLEMTLASGLGELATLKDLRVLSVLGMNHRISDAELEWMDAHWPRLERVEGLCDKDGNAEPEVKAWIWKNNPRWKTPGVRVNF